MILLSEFPDRPGNISRPDSDAGTIHGGFSVFLRFLQTRMLAVSIIIYSIGVLVQVANCKQHGFRSGYKNGYLTAYARDDSDNLIEILIHSNHAYQYPLSVLLTYNDHQSRKLKLYTDNEAHKHTLTEAFGESFENIMSGRAASAFTKIRTKQGC